MNLNSNEIDKYLDAAIGSRIEGINDALDAAIEIHEQINPAGDAERLEGIAGCGAMGAVIEYREAIKRLKQKLNGEL